MKIRYKAPRGTKDFLFEEASALFSFEEKARKIFQTFGYREVRLPILEETALFNRSLGRSSEIVEKQLFRIKDKEELCLRPEATTQVVRSFIEHHLFKTYKILKVFYIGAMFRGERPQKGRLRQFHHIGAEALGIDNPYIDAEIIKLSQQIISSLGIENIKIEINSLGCQKDKEKFKNLLKKKLEPELSKLCEHCQRRFSFNTLRILDCKNSTCRELVRKLELNHTYLCKECLEFFSSLIKILTELKIAFSINNFLVRGLDYYTQTIFEIKNASLGSQDAVGAGGRYDNLVGELGGPRTSAVGFALGLERLLLLKKHKEEPKCQVFIAYVPESLYHRAFMLLQSLRDKGISCQMDYLARSLGAQLRYSQRLEIDRVVILGEEELKRKEVILKDMRTSSQKKIKIEDLKKILTG